MTQPINRPPLEMQLAWAINTSIRLQGFDVDRNRLQAAISKHPIHTKEGGFINPTNSSFGNNNYLKNTFKDIARDAGIEKIEEYINPDPARMPAIAWLENYGWVVIRGLNTQNQWIVDIDGSFVNDQSISNTFCFRAVPNLAKKFNTLNLVLETIKSEFFTHKKLMFEAGIASVLTNFLAIATSLYSMQVYDRVIPTQGYETLFVLTTGVGIALIFDLAIKIARSYLMESVICQIDSNLSRAVFSRFLNIRIDQLPSSVGTLSSQLRSFETIRSFLSTKTFYVFVDIPFSLIFILSIALIANPFIALIPLFFLLISILFGFATKDIIDSHARMSTDASNKKTGLLVEAIEGAETIKSGAGSWGFLSKWIDTSEKAMDHDMALRSITEKTSYASGLLQQVSYVGLICAGAYIAGEGQLTMGALIACSILSGRALAPIGQIPALMVQAAHAKAALAQLEKVYSLEVDNNGIDRPLIPEKINGKYQLDRVRFAYQASPNALVIEKLNINAGEKIGIVGPVGAGKSTLLRLLTGMYSPNEGTIHLDDFDIHSISQRLLSEKVGYLQQDHRLFSGTLRENLLVGNYDPGDDKLKEVASKTGLIDAISSHPKGLDLQISEGGKGLSGGQRQLVAITRLMLSDPSVWLLDEPTASMDNASEIRCIDTFKSYVKPEHTFLIVTHKLELLKLCNRIVCIANHKIMLDGERDDVLRKLTSS